MTKHIDTKKPQADPKPKSSDAAKLDIGDPNAITSEPGKPIPPDALIDDPLADLSYEDTKKEIAEHTQRIGVLKAHLERLEWAYNRSDNWKDTLEDPPLKSDEGIAYTRVSTHRIVNLTDQEDKVNAHRLELHVDSKVYTHVEETSTGEWIYRNDT